MSQTVETSYQQLRKRLGHTSQSQKVSDFHQYSEELRKWLRLYNSYQATYCAQSAESFNSENTSNNDNSHVPQATNVPNNAQPPNPADGPSVRLRKAPLLTRALAELVDGIVCFVYKFAMIFFMVEFGLLEVDDYEWDDESTVVDFFLFTQSMFTLEIAYKVFISFVEAIVLVQSFGMLENGQTPGKSLMKIVIVRGTSITHHENTGEVVIQNIQPLTFGVALIRSLLKNLLVNGLFPFSTLALGCLNFYDAAGNTCVVVV